MKRGMIAIAVLTSLWVTLPRPSAAQDTETNEETHAPTSSEARDITFSYVLAPGAERAANGETAAGWDSFRFDPDLRSA